MTLLSPWAFWFLSIVPVIVMLYLLKLKRRPVQVSTLMFWQRVLLENRRRAFFQRLRQWLSLLLHLLIFLLILLALARPEFDRFVKSGSSTVLILDDRARMQAVEDDGKTRFEKARELLATYISRAGDQNQMALLLAHGTPEVAVPFSGSEKTLQQSITSLQPTDSHGDLESTIHLADELLASRSGAKRIVVFTDTKPPAVNSKSQIEFVSLGTSRDNVAITRFATRPLPAGPETSQIFLEIRNFGSKPASGGVEIRFDGDLLDVKPFNLPARGQKTVIFPSVPQAGKNSRGWLTARLDVKDALASDNEAYAVLSAREPVRVLLVTKGNWFLEKMLASHDLLKFDLLAPDDFQAGMAKSFDAVILDNVIPPGFDLQNAAGNILFIGKTPFASGTKTLDQPLITDVDTRSPLLRTVNLKNVTFLKAQEIPFQETAGAWHFTAPLRSFEHPLVITGTRDTGEGGQRMAAFAFDIADSDLPLRIAFPLLMSNTLEWLAGEKMDAVQSYRAGDVMELQPGQRVWKEPQQKFSTVPEINAGQMASHSFQPLRNGFYLVQNGATQAWVPVNTFDESESDLQQPHAGAAAEQNPGHISSITLLLASRPPWNYLVLAAFALFTLEWWLYHRRRTE